MNCPGGAVGNLILATAALLAVATGCIHDPSAGILTTKQEARNLECSRLSQLEAHERYPSQVPDLASRGAYLTRDALVCSRRIIELGERPARDEAILTSLRESVSDITRAAEAIAPAQTVWHVDAFYPRPEVAQKIAVAARVDLAERGLIVSDRVPVLSAGDIAVLVRTGADTAYALACSRYFSEHALAGDDAFLGLMTLDKREVALHAGVCMRGEWKWLQ